MKFFRRKEKVLDLTKTYERDYERIKQRKERDNFNLNNISENSLEKKEITPFLGFESLAQNQENSSGMNSSFNESFSSGDDDRKRKLAKRLADMTEKVEELSNEVYRLKQRIEVLEKKNNVNFFD